MYQYFATKEEVIGCSILYYLEKEMRKMVGSLKCITGFRHRLDLVLDQIQHNVQDPLSPFRLLSSAKEYGGFVKKCTRENGSMAMGMERFHQVADF